MYNINDLSYTAHENPEWFTRAMFGGRLIAGGYIGAITGVKGDELLSMIDLQNKILQIDGRDCAWTPNQIIKLSEKRAKVQTYKINLEQCIDELENKRTVYQLKPGATNEELPPELEAATMMLIAIGLSNEIEEMIVGGDSSKDENQFDGMEKQLLDSKQAAQLKGEAITDANVLGAFEKTYDALSEDVLQAEDTGTLFFFTSYGVRRKIVKALSAKNNQNITNNWDIDKTDVKNPRVYYLGVEVVPVKGIGKNTIILIDGPTNALLLTDLMSDLEQVELGQFPKPNDNKVWIKGRLRMGFVIPFEDETVIWSDLVTADREADPNGGQLEVSPSSLVFAAAGETKTFNITTPTKVVPTISEAPAGFTATKGEVTTAGGFDVTPVTVVASDNTGNSSPRTGELTVSLPDDSRSVTVTLNQRYEDPVIVTD